jgi:hypothetical protein
LLLSSARYSASFSLNGSSFGQGWTLRSYLDADYPLKWIFFACRLTIDAQFSQYQQQRSMSPVTKPPSLPTHTFLSNLRGTRSYFLHPSDKIH